MKLEFKRSRKPIYLIMSIVITILLILLSIATFVFIVQGVLSTFWWIFLVITYWSINLLITQALFSSAYNKHSRWKWLSIIWLLPLFGGILYLILGKVPVTRSNKLKNSKDIREKVLDIELQKYKSENMDIIDNHIKRKNSNNSSIKIVTSSLKFRELFISIENAESYIHMEYYIFKQGEIFYDLFQILEKKIKEGVEVRIIIDNVGSLSIPSSEIRKWKDAGIQLSVFNRIRPPFFSGYVNLRMHRKVIIIDGKEGFIGGMNIGDEYIGLSKKMGDWLDIHLHIEGKAIEELSKQFLLDWKYSTTEDLLKEKKYIESNTLVKNNDLVKIVEDGPDVLVSSFEESFLSLTQNAKKRLWISTPYTIIPRKIMKKIISVAQSGVDVKLFIPGRQDKKLLYRVGKYYISKLNDNKVEVYRTKNLFLHSKMILWDDSISMVGTSNMDFRSLYTNYEINIFIDSNKTNMEIQDQFNELIKISERVNPSYNSHYPWNIFKDFIYWLMTPFL